ncbi:MAG: tetratricopeptide repeat protein [Candidatus Omnitrophota bacterium]
MRLFNFFVAEYLFKQGQTYFGKNMIEPAIQAYNSALKISPKNHGVYLHKALALSRLERYEEAVDAVEQAIKLNPYNPVYPLFAGIISLDANQAARALKCFDDSARLAEAYIFAKQYRTLALLKAKKITEAIANIYKYGFSSDNGFKSRLLLIMRQLKNEIEDKEFQMIKEIADKFLKGQGLQFSSASKKIQNLITKFENTKKKDLKAQYKIAQKLYTLGAFEKVLEICQAIIMKNPDDAKIIKLQGEAYFNMERYADAENCFNKIRKEFSSDVEIIFKLGISLFQQKKLDEAIENFLVVLNLSGNTGKNEVAYWLGKAYLEKKQIGQAIHYLTIAFEGIENAFFNDAYAKIIYE